MLNNKEKFLWYFLFSIIGVFTAEVCSWSSPFVLIDPITFIIVWPIYAFHYFVFVPILLEKKWYKDWRIIYLFGALLGMYEFVITKVYFSPPWGGFFMFMGVDIISIIWVGFIWHAFFSFVIPFYIMILLFFPVERELAIKWLKRSFYAIAFAFSIFGVISPTMDSLIKSGIYYFGLAIMVLLIFIISIIFRLIAFRIGRKDYKLQDFIVSRRTKTISLALLIFIYVFYGITLRTEALPKTPNAYLIPAVIYGLIILSIIKAKKKSFFRLEGKPLIKEIRIRDLNAYMMRFFLITLIIWMISLIARQIFYFILMLLVYTSPIMFAYVLYRILKG